MAGMKGGKRLVGPSVVQKKSNGEKELEPRLARSAQWVQPRSMRKTHSSVDLPVSAEINAKTWVQRRRMRKTLAHFKINAIRSGPTQKYAQNSCSFQDDSFFRSYRPCPFLLGFTGFDWIWMSPAGIDWVSFGPTVFYWFFSLGFSWNFIEFYWVLLGFTGF